MKKLLLKALILTSCIALLSGCGNDTGIDLGPGGCVTAPYDATISADLSSIDYTYGGSNPPVTDTFYLNIRVKNNAGIPLNDVILNIDFPWSSPSPNASIQLYDGNTKKDASMNVCTDVDGNYTLKVEYAAGCEISYFGDFHVWSGSVSMADDVTLTLEGEDCT